MKIIENAKRIISLFLLIVVFLSSCGKSINCEADTGPTDVQPVYEQLDEDKTTSETVFVPPTSDYSSSGVFTTDTGTSLSLIIEWNCYQMKDRYSVYIHVNVYLKYKGIISCGETVRNRLVINGEAHSFAVEELLNYPEDASPVLLYSYQKAIPREDVEDLEIPLSAKYEYNGYYDGYYFNALQAHGTVVVSDKYDEMPRAAKEEVEIVYQYPELPNGCEVTSLTMLLRHVGYDVDKMTLKNNYLPIGRYDFNKYNIGDPSTIESYGCYSPVLIKTAEEYISENGGEHTVKSFTHYSPEELYYQISKGNPVIVWITIALEEPTILETWRVGNVFFNWKHPEHCVLLTGYDLEQRTVVTLDPISGEKEYDMDAFEECFHKMGEQAVVIE